MHASIWASDHQGRFDADGAAQPQRLRDHQHKYISTGSSPIFKEADNTLTKLAKNVSSVDASAYYAGFNEQTPKSPQTADPKDHTGPSIAQTVLTTKQYQETDVGPGVAKVTDTEPQDKLVKLSIDSPATDPQSVASQPRRVTYDAQQLMSVRKAAIPPRRFSFMPTTNTAVKQRSSSVVPVDESPKISEIVSRLAQITKEKKQVVAKAAKAEESNKVQSPKTPELYSSNPVHIASPAGGSPTSISSPFAKLTILDTVVDIDAVRLLPPIPFSFTFPTVVSKTDADTQTDPLEDRSTLSKDDSRKVVLKNFESIDTKTLSHAMTIIDMLIASKRKEDILLVDALNIIKSSIAKTLAAIEELGRLSPNKIESPPALPPQHINLNIGTGRITGKLKQFHCTLCNTSKVYNDLVSLTQHCSAKHFHCEKCHLVYATHEEFIRHLVAAKDQHNFCELCLIDFGSKDGYNRHLAGLHPESQKPIVCPGCKMVEKGPYQLIRHLEGNLCPTISLLQFNQARTFVALNQRHSLGSIQQCSAKDRDAIKSQSLKLLRGDDFVVAGPPLPVESVLSATFSCNRFRRTFPNGTIWTCFYQDCHKLFDDLDRFQNHLRAGHFTHGVCPSCHKECESPSKLLHHFIAGPKDCHISSSPLFSYAVTAVTGGFVAAKTKDQHGRWIFVAGEAPNSRPNTRPSRATPSK